MKKQEVTNKKSMGKLSLSALSLGMLLMLSACSGGDNTAADDTAAINDTETAVVEVAEPAVNTEAAATTSITEPAVDDTTVVEVPVATAAVTAEPIAAETELLAVDAGAKLYESNCKVCHQNGLLNAPKYGDVTAWAPRIAKGKEILYTHSAKGFNKMPAQANDEVSEAQVHAAVDYMIAAAS